MKTISGKLLIFSFLCTSSLLAQDSLSVIGKFIQDHSWTMDFGISSNLTLKSFQGTAISLSKFTSDYQKYRLGVSVGLNQSSGDQSGSQYNADTLSNNSNAHSDNYNNSLQITFQYITYATPKAQTSIYFGIGPLVGISWYKNNSNSNTNSVGDYQNQSGYTNTNSNYFVGVLGSVGVEWFFSEHISIHAEYGLSAQYNWGNTQLSNTYQTIYNPILYTNSYYSNRNNNSSSSSGWNLSGQSVLFGLSVNY
jgi:hypothetical protein